MEQIMARCVKEIRHEDVGWIHLAQDGNKWWALVSTVMKLWVPSKLENFLTT
jgi:hypothetical protein